MNRDRRYPEATTDSFAEPPVEYTDQEGRRIRITVAGNGAVDTEAEALAEMYDGFDPADRAQGIPPSRRGAIESWLAELLDPEGLNVIAWHGNQAVGHATLVPNGSDAYELAIFVHQDYQRAGIGRQLMEAILGAAQKRDIENIWLTVEQWNTAAKELYQSVGFDIIRSESFEIEMALSLPPDSGGGNGSSDG